MKSQDRVANLLAAKAMLDELPDAALYPRLGDWANSALTAACINNTPIVPQRRKVKGWRAERACGAVACFGGWVAQTPYFQNRGVKCDHEDGSPYMYGEKYGEKYQLGTVDTAYELFGDYRMFSARQEDERGLTEREIIEQRIQKALDKELVGW